MTSVVVNTHSSVVEDDEVLYPCNDDPKPDLKPEPEKDCCCKTYHVVLHFH